MSASVRRSLLLTLLALAAGSVLFVGVASVRSKTADTATAADAQKVTLEFLPADLLTLKPAALVRTLPLTGTLAALNEATLKAKVAGELVELSVREGESVKRGQTLARIDQTEVLARVAARKADVAAARAQLVWAEKNRNTQKALLDKSFISQNAFDNVQSSHDVAIAKLGAAEADLVMAQKSLGDSVLVAPMNGIVAQRHAQPGERVPLDAKVITVVDLTRLELAASVPAANIAQVRIGQSVGFRVDGFGEREFSGRIERINPATTAGSRAITVYAVIDNPQSVLRSGLFAQGGVILERIENALAMPASALREEAGQSFVYVIEGGTLRKRIVKAGAGDGAGNLPVLEGLREGDVIVRQNLGLLRDGAAVRIAQSASGSAPAPR
jgi:membrane fusion protein (multidrug efflux system)